MHPLKKKIIALSFLTTLTLITLSQAHADGDLYCESVSNTSDSKYAKWKDSVNWIQSGNVGKKSGDGGIYLYGNIEFKGHRQQTYTESQGSSDLTFSPTSAPLPDWIPSPEAFCMALSTICKRQFGSDYALVGTSHGGGNEAGWNPIFITQNNADDYECPDWHLATRLIYIQKSDLRETNYYDVTCTAATGIKPTTFSKTRDGNNGWTNGDHTYSVSDFDLTVDQLNEQVGSKYCIGI
jgi:hypothetical protein